MSQRNDERRTSILKPIDENKGENVGSKNKRRVSFHTHRTVKEYDKATMEVDRTPQHESIHFSGSSDDRSSFFNGRPTTSMTLEENQSTSVTFPDNTNVTMNSTVNATIAMFNRMSEGRNEVDGLSPDSDTTLLSEATIAVFDRLRASSSEHSKDLLTSQFDAASNSSSDDKAIFDRLKNPSTDMLDNSENETLSTSKGEATVAVFNRLKSSSLESTDKEEVNVSASKVEATVAFFDRLRFSTTGISKRPPTPENSMLPNSTGNSIFDRPQASPVLGNTYKPDESLNTDAMFASEHSTIPQTHETENEKMETSLEFRPEAIVSIFDHLKVPSKSLESIDKEERSIEISKVEATIAVLDHLRPSSSAQISSPLMSKSPILKSITSEVQVQSNVASKAMPLKNMDSTYLVAGGPDRGHFTDESNTINDQTYCVPEQVRQGGGDMDTMMSEASPTGTLIFKTSERTKGNIRRLSDMVKRNKRRSSLLSVGTSDTVLNESNNVFGIPGTRPTTAATSITPTVGESIGQKEMISQDDLSCTPTKHASPNLPHSNEVKRPRYGDSFDVENLLDVQTPSKLFCDASVSQHNMLKSMATPTPEIMNETVTIEIEVLPKDTLVSAISDRTSTVVSTPNNDANVNLPSSESDSFIFKTPVKSKFNEQSFHFIQSKVNKQPFNLIQSESDSDIFKTPVKSMPIPTLNPAPPNVNKPLAKILEKIAVMSPCYTPSKQLLSRANMNANVADVSLITPNNVSQDFNHSQSERLKAKTPKFDKIQETLIKVQEFKEFMEKKTFDTEEFVSQGNSILQYPRTPKGNMTSMMSISHGPNLNLEEPSFNESGLMNSTHKSSGIYKIFQMSRLGCIERQFTPDKAYYIEEVRAEFQKLKVLLVKLNLEDVIDVDHIIPEFLIYEDMLTLNILICMVRIKKLDMQLAIFNGNNEGNSEHICGDLDIVLQQLEVIDNALIKVRDELKLTIFTFSKFNDKRCDFLVRLSNSDPVAYEAYLQDVKEVKVKLENLKKIHDQRVMEVTQELKAHLGDEQRKKKEMDKKFKLIIEQLEAQKAHLLEE